MAEVEVVLHHAEIDFMKSWEGAIGRSVERLAKETVYRQQVYGNKRTGYMVGRMHYTKKTYVRGIGFLAGSNAPYTLYVDQGTVPHKILPKKPGGMLVFYWAKVGHVVHLRSVNHPGNKAYDFLTKGLRRALGVWGRSG